jgi:hypothetical protein
MNAQFAPSASRLRLRLGARQGKKWPTMRASLVLGILSLHMIAFLLVAPEWLSWRGSSTALLSVLRLKANPPVGFNLEDSAGSNVHLPLPQKSIRSRAVPSRDQYEIVNRSIVAPELGSVAAPAAGGRGGAARGEHGGEQGREFVQKRYQTRNHTCKTGASADSLYRTRRRK